MNTINQQYGLSLVELLVSLFILSIISLGAFTMFTQAATTYNDIAIRESTNDSAKAILNILGSDIRMIGNGIPFDQPNFEINDSLEALPITTPATEVYQDNSGNEENQLSHPIDIRNSSDDEITYKLNETGIVRFLSANFIPTGSTIQLDTTAGLIEGDRIYISDKLLSGSDETGQNGFTAVISSIDSATNITIDTSTAYRSLEVSNFGIGSTLEPVRTVRIYNEDGKVKRDSGLVDADGDPIIATIADNASFTLKYWADDGITEMTVPSTSSATYTTEVHDFLRNLGSIEITVNVTSTSTHKVLETPFQQYTFTRSQTYALRSFNFSMT